MSKTPVLTNQREVFLRFIDLIGADPMDYYFVTSPEMLMGRDQGQFNLICFGATPANSIKIEDEAAARGIRIVRISAQW